MIGCSMIFSSPRFKQNQEIVAKWNPDFDNKMKSALNISSTEMIEKIVTEIDNEITVCIESLSDLQRWENFISRADCNDLRWNLMISLNAAIVWKYLNVAFFGYKVLLDHNSNSIKERVIGAVDYLERWALKTEKELSEDFIPINPARIRNFVFEMRERLSRV